MSGRDIRADRTLERKRHLSAMYFRADRTFERNVLLSGLDIRADKTLERTRHLSAWFTQVNLGRLRLGFAVKVFIIREGRKNVCRDRLRVFL